MIKTFTIIAVRKSPKNTITHVQLDGEPATTQPKFDVIRNIEHNICRYIVQSGAEVRAVPKGSGRYIRSVPNDTEEDNLGNLPEFDIPGFPDVLTY